MSVLDYYMKFKKLSKYAPSMPSNKKVVISYFLVGVSDDLVEQYRSSMIHYNMNISRLMVHAQQVEESRLRRKNKRRDRKVF